MNIAVLNDCYLEKSHLSRLKKLGKVFIYKETLSESLAIKRLKDIDVAIIHCSLLPITAKILKSTKNLKYISLASTGYDRVDLSTARSLNILISNLPTYATESVAEHTIGLIFSVIRKIVCLDRSFRNKPYEINFLPKNKLITFQAENLRNKTLGIIGVGNIGQRITQIASSIGMNILGNDIRSRKISNIRMVSLEELLKESDVVSLHTNLNETSKYILGKKQLFLMKKNAILINTARGGLVDEDALYQCLINRKIAGAGLDTIENMKKSNLLLKLPNVVFTPHSAWYSDESCRNIADGVIANIESFSYGSPLNIIS